MEELVKEHLEKFGVEPNVIGRFFGDPRIVMENIEEAIDSDVPYDEYRDLTDEQKKAYDAGELNF